MTLRNNVILDKNFIQGAKKDVVIGVCREGFALMPDVLFYEMITAPEPARSRCFAKFPGECPVPLVPSVGVLLAYELQNHKPCGQPSLHSSRERWKFNDKLAEGAYTLPPEVQETLREEEDRLHGEITTLVEMINMAPDLFPDVFVRGADRDVERAKVERVLATEHGAIVDFYSRLEPPDASVRPPPAKELTPDWIHFRWLQVKLWASLDLRLRLGPVDDDPSEGRRHKLENYLHDMQYLMLALLEGGLASEDEWMRRAFKLLAPNGELRPTDADLTAKKGVANGDVSS
jgi:hypothetical protein